MRRIIGSLAVCAVTWSLGCGGQSESHPVANSPAASAHPAASAGDAEHPSAESAGSENPHASAAASEAPAPQGTEAAAPPKSDQAADGELQLDRLAFKVPAGWARKDASSSFVLVEYTLPKAEGSEDGRLTVSVAGGSVEANVERWKSQFGGKPEKETQEKKEVGGLEVTVVDFTGEFNDQRGPFSPPTKRPNYRMIAAIIPVEGELHFVKATGPAATMENHRQAFLDFVTSARKK